MQNTTKQAQFVNMADAVSKAISFIQSTGPVDMEQIAFELRKQCHGVNRDNAMSTAEMAMIRAMDAGLIEYYDENENSLVIA